jgi:hypothetical protein
MATLESLYRTVGDYDIVWEILYATDVYHRVDDGTGSGDTVPAGRTREQRIAHIVAPTIATAKAAFTHLYPPHVNYEAVKFTPLCTIDYIVKLGRI